MESPSWHTMIEFTVDLLKMRQSLKCEGEKKPIIIFIIRLFFSSRRRLAIMVASKYLFCIARIYFSFSVLEMTL